MARHRPRKRAGKSDYAVVGLTFVCILAGCWSAIALGLIALTAAVTK